MRSHCFHRFQYHANSSAQPPDCNNTAEILFVNPLVNPEATILFLTTPDEDDDGNCPAGDIVSESQHLRDEDMDMDLGEDDDDIFIEVDTPVIEDELGDLSGSSDMSREGSWQPPDVLHSRALMWPALQICATLSKIHGRLSTRVDWTASSVGKQEVSGPPSPSQHDS